MQLSIRRGVTHCTDAVQAATELVEQVHQDDAGITLIFASSRYDLEALGQALTGSLRGPVVGCSTSGEIGPEGYSKGAAVAVSLASPGLSVITEVIEDLASFDVERAERVGDDLRSRMAPLLASGDRRAFALLLADGLSLAEERLTAYLSPALGHIPLLGGSAGDDLGFERTFVLGEGSFASDRAALAVFVTSHPFLTFRTQHFEQTDEDLVITEADGPSRTVFEINAAPAAEEYAELLGLTVDQLGPDVFSDNPVVLSIGGEQYVRSIQRANPDGSLTFYCAIDEGLVLSLARGQDLVGSTRQALDEIRERLDKPRLILGCECILRRLEAEGRDLTGAMGEIMSEHEVVGFHTYGEQYGALHVNQTLVGVALGE